MVSDSPSIRNYVLNSHLFRQPNWTTAGTLWCLRGPQLGAPSPPCAWSGLEMAQASSMASMRGHPSLSRLTSPQLETSGESSVLATWSWPFQSTAPVFAGAIWHQDHLLWSHRDLSSSMESLTCSLLRACAWRCRCPTVAWLAMLTTVSDGALLRTNSRSSMRQASSSRLQSGTASGSAQTSETNTNW